MSVTFNVFTKRNRFFYTGLIISFLTAIYVAWGAIYNVQFKQPFMGILDVLLFIGCLTTVGFVITAGLGLINTYIKDGDLVLADDHVVINGVKIPLNEAKAIDMKVATNRRLGNLLSNKILVTGAHDEIYQNRFVVKGYNNYLELENILNHWCENSVAFNVRYHSV